MKPNYYIGSMSNIVMFNCALRKSVVMSFRIYGFPKKLSIKNHCTDSMYNVKITACAISTKAGGLFFNKLNPEIRKIPKILFVMLNIIV